MITPEELKGAIEVLGRLADRIDKPDAQGRVRIPFQKSYFAAIQKLMKGTEWNERYCWEDGVNGVMLSVDVRPPPVRTICGYCNGKGTIEKYP
jgi:hypothetical protein